MAIKPYLRSDPPTLNDDPGYVARELQKIETTIKQLCKPAVAVADATGSGDIVAQFNTLLAALRDRGIIET